MLIHQDADFFIHLGDGAVSFYEYCTNNHLPFIALKGNCDLSLFGYPLEKSAVLEFEGYRFFMAHGDAFYVSASRTRLALEAKKSGCDVALYGHTHIAENKYLPAEGEEDKPIYIFNPGSISKPRAGGNSYGVIEIIKGQLLLNVADISY